MIQSSNREEEPKRRNSKVSSSAIKRTNALERKKKTKGMAR
jgi:hypothetical protein